MCFDLQIRNTGMAIAAFCSNLSLFGILKVFPILLEMIGLHGCMAIFGICSMMGVVFVSFVLKETRGISLDDVGSNEQVKTQHT